MHHLPALIRSSEAADLPAIAEVYRSPVLQGTGTFELPAIDEMARRRDEVLGKGLPWLVVMCGDTVQGNAHANHFRPRPAFRYCLVDSIYLATNAMGRGLGRLLLAELNARCEQAGRAPDAGGDRRLGKCILDENASGVGPGACRPDQGGRLEVRPLAGRRVDAEAPPPGAERGAVSHSPRQLTPVVLHGRIQAHRRATQ
jgi:L-amino acid N-acyltransferase YncA